MSSKNTKRAWLSSLLAIVLCLSMLIGTTFAWFTDTASTGVNKIVAGNLDVEVEYWKDTDQDGAIDDDEWATIESKTDLFSTTLWEPGHTEVAYLRITNKGTLALDYALTAYAAAETEGRNAAGNAFKLSSVLKFAMTTPSTGSPAVLDRTTARALTGKTLGETYAKDVMAPRTTEYFALCVYMPEDTGNDYNYATGTTAPYIDLKIVLNAIQAESESDSFGSDYDKLANGTPDNPRFDQPLTTVETKAGALPTKVENGVETVRSETVVEGGGATITYPVGAKVDSSSSKEDGTEHSSDATQGMVYTGNTPTGSISVSDGDTLAVYDLTLPTTADNTVPVKVVTNIGSGKRVPALYHNTTELYAASSDALAYPDGKTAYTGDEGCYYYDVSTGNLTVWVLHASEIVVHIQNLFANGDGTAANPYQIATTQDLLNTYYCDGPASGETTYYQLTADITAGDTPWSVWGYSVYMPYLENVVFDGNGHTITFAEDKYHPEAPGSVLIANAKGCTFKNLKVDNLSYCLATQTVNCVFDDVDLLSGKFTATGNEGAYMVYGWESIHFTDCETNVDLIGSGETTNYNAAFVGYAGHNGTNKFDMSFTNCTNSGDIICGTAAMFLGNPSQINPGGNTADWTLKITNCVNNGTIQSTYMGSGAYEENHVVAVYSDKNFKHHFPNIVVDDKTVTNVKDVVISCGENGKFIKGPTDSDLAVTKNEDGTFTVTPSKKENVASYKVSLTLYTGLVDQVGSQRYSVSETITVGDGVSLTTAMKQLSFVGLEYLTGKGYTQSDASFNSDVKIVTIDGQNYYLVNDEELTLNGNIRPAYVITVSAFDANGVLLASTGLTN